MNPHRIEDIVARIGQGIADLPLHKPATPLLQLVHSTNGEPERYEPAPMSPHLYLVAPSKAPEHYAPPREWPRWAERLADWALAITIGLVMGISAGSGF